MSLYLVVGFFFILLIIYICKCQSSIEGLRNANFLKYEKCFENSLQTDPEPKYIQDPTIKHLWHWNSVLTNQFLCINDFINEEFDEFDEFDEI